LAQKITSEQLSISPILMSAANSSGGVMGKMIDAQSIVVASTATNWFGHEGTILGFVFWHSIVLASLVGYLVMLQAYVFTGMIVHWETGRTVNNRSSTARFRLSKPPSRAGARRRRAPECRWRAAYLQDSNAATETST
jgi:hypothetical protein